MGQNSTICRREDTATNGSKASDCCAPVHINKLLERVKGKSLILFFLITLMGASSAFAWSGCNIYTPPSNHSEQWSSQCNSHFQSWLSSCGGAKAYCGQGCNDQNVTWSNNCNQGAPVCGCNTVVFTCKDNCGNTATCSAQFCVTGPGGLTIGQCSNDTVQCNSPSCSSNFNSWLSNHGGCSANENNCNWSNNCKSSSPPSCCNSTTVVFTCSDACGNTNTCKGVFCVGSGGNLKITKQASNETVACGSSVSSEFSSWLSSQGGATASDNGTVTWTNNCNVSAPSGCGCVTVVFTATDNCGNTATTSAQFCVTGAGALTITKQASDENVACGSSSCSSSFSAWLNSHGGATASDNCSSVSWTSNCHVSAPSCCNSVTVVFTASDNCGNTATTSATFSVGGNGGNLRITKQAQNDNVACGSSVSSEFSAWLANYGGATASDNGPVTWTSNCKVSAPSSCSCVTVVFTASDACGNTASTSAQFCVSGAGALTITTPARNDTVVCGSSMCNTNFNTWLSNHGGAVASDNCSSVSWSSNCHVSAPSCCNYVTVVFTASDACGNTATTSATFYNGTGGDLEITKQAQNETVACGSSVNSEFSAWLSNHGGATASDNGTVSWTNNCNVSAPSGCGSVTVVFTVTDNCGNSASTSAKFSVSGAGALSITKPAGNDTVACCTGVDSCSINFNNWCKNHGCSGITSCENNYNNWCGSHGYGNSGPWNCSGCENCFNNWIQNNGGDCKDPCGYYSSCEASFKAWCQNYGTNGQGKQPSCYADYLTCFNSWCASHNNSPVPCNSYAYNAWLSNQGGAVATDNCSSVTWTNNAPSAVPACCSSVTVIFTATDACGNTATTSGTFNVGGGGSLKITPAKNDTVLCSSSVGAAFTAWLNNNGGATATDAGTVTWSNNANSNEIVPQTCGCVTVIFTATDNCGNSASTSAQFCVSGAGALKITKGATNETVPCNEEATSAFHSWLNSYGGATATDNCSTPSWSNNSNGVAPACCNHVTVVFTVSDVCGNTATTSASFYVGGGGSVAVTPAHNDTANCSINVDSAFNVWLANNGGSTTTVQDVTWSNNAGADEIVPVACGCVTVVFTATDTCGNTGTTSAQFCVGSSPYKLSVPANDTVNSCQSQADINRSYAGWLALANVTGGCSPALTNNSTGAPVACGGTATVTFTVVDACGNSSDSSSSFTVRRSPPVVFNCISDTTVSSCQNQAAVIAAFNSWLGSASVSGGCSPSLTNSGGTPSACGGITTVNFYVTDSCGYTNSCSANFTVNRPAPVVFTCAVNDTVVPGSTVSEDSLDILFNNWLNTATVTGGCSPQISNDGVVPPLCGGTDTVTFTVTDSCGYSNSCTAYFVVIGTPVGLVCPHDTTETLVCGHIHVNPPVEAICFRAHVTQPDFTCANVGVNYDTLVVVNNMGDTISVCTWMVTVIDTVTISQPGANDTIYCPATTLSFTPPTTAACNILHADTLPVPVGGCSTNHTIKWWATDSCGISSDTVSQTITVADSATPSITSPGANDTLTCGASPVFTAPTAGNNCSPIPLGIVSYTDTTTAGCTTVYTRYWYAYACNGKHSDTVSQSVTVTDTTTPTIGIPGASASIPCGTTPVFTAPTASGACGNVVIDSFSSTVTVGCSTTYTRSWYAVDLCNYKVSDTVSQVISTTCSSSLQLGTPGKDTSLSCANCLNGGLPPFTAPSFTDSCCKATLHSSVDTIAGACAQSYTVTKSWWATDTCGHVSDTVSQSISVIDNTPPTIFGQGDDTTVACGSVPPFWNPSAHDICDLNPIIYDTTITVAGKCPQAYTITRYWWAIDACGNISDTVNQSINVIDTAAPVLFNQGANVNVSCPTCGVCIPGFTSPSVHDLCDLNPRISYTDDTIPGKCTAAYSITRTWTAQDACGNISKPVSQTITVGDTIRPTVSGQGKDTVIECSNSPVFTPPTPHDNCDKSPSLYFYTDTTGSTCDRTYTRCWWAVDACGNHSDTVCQAIQLVDSIRPTVSGQGDDTTIECSSAPVFTAPTPSDNCDANPALYSYKDTVSGGCPQSYRVTTIWWAVDACGNHSDTVSQTINVIDTIAPKLSGVGMSKMIACYGTPVFQGPTATDNCDPNPKLDSTTVRTNGTCEYDYTLTRKWWATDACGNVSDTMHQSIRIIDNTPPTVGGQGGNATIYCPNTPEFTAPTAKDTCDLNPTLYSYSDTTKGNCPQAYSVTRYWYAIDSCGNISDTVHQTISVLDTTRPILNGPGANATIYCPNQPVFTPPTVESSYCASNPTLHSDTVAVRSECPFPYSITIYWWATDSCGNVSDTVSQKITVMDTTKPVLSGQGPSTSIYCTGTPVFTGPTVSDDCETARVDSSTDTTYICHHDKYSITRCWWAIAGCGDYLHYSDTVCQTITVMPIPPVAKCKSDTVYLDTLSSESSIIVITPQDIDSGSYSICGDSFNLAVYPDSFDCRNAGYNIVTLYAYDQCGDTTTCQDTLVIIQPPVRCPGPQSVTLNCGIGVLGEPVFAIDTCDIHVLISQDTFTCENIGPNIITIYSVNAFGDTTICYVTVNVTDNVTIGAPGPNDTVQCGTFDVLPLTPPSIESCYTLNHYDDTVRHCGSTYSLTRYWFASDSCGTHSDTVSQTVTVIDTIPPTLSGQGSDTSLSCVACLINGLPKFTPPTATGSCGIMPTIYSQRDSVPGKCPQSYSIVMKWWAKDTCGHVSDTVSQTISVSDTTPPTISGQGPDTTVSCSSVIPVITPSAHDGCDLNPTVYQWDTTIAGSCPSAYTLIYKWWAIDHCGNISDTVEQIINVIDTTPPVLYGQGANVYVSCPTCGVCVPGFTSPSVHDVCDLNPRISYTDDTIPGKCTAAFSITRTWNAIDACGNRAKPVSQTITVTDTIPPTLSGQGPNDTVVCPSTPVFTPPTAHDNCDKSPTVYADTTTVTSKCTIETTIRWWAVDACGNHSDTVSQSVTVIHGKPTIGGQGPNAMISCPNTPSFTPPTASSPCDVTPTIYFYDDTMKGDCPQSYSVTRYWYAEDSCGNLTDTVHQKITVIDNTPPTVTGQGDDTTIVCSSTPVFTAPIASDECDPTPRLHSLTDTVKGACPQSYRISRSWWAIDTCGNISDTVTQVINVIDTVRPTISGQGDDTTISCSASPVFKAPTASGHCDAATRLYSTTDTAKGACPQSYRVTRSWWAIDTCGNMSDTVSQTINVIDTIRPVLSGEGHDTTIQCSSTPVFKAPTATGGCDAITRLHYFTDTTKGNCPQSYRVTRSWWATDSCGNISDTVSQTINVIDTARPIVTGQGKDTTISCVACLNGVPGFVAPTVIGSCSTPTLYVSRDSTPGACPQSYSITKRWWAIDSCGNVSDTVSQTVNVIDNTPPTLTGQGVNETVSCDGNQSFTNPAVHDDCDLNPTVYAWDTTIQGNCPSAYTLIKKWWAIDHCGNISDTVSQTITVIDTTAPVLSGQGANEYINCPSCGICVPGFTSPNVTDACDLNPRLSYTDVTTQGNCANAYTITRTWTAIDACGNVSKPVSQTITVADTTPPVLNCPIDSIVACGSQVVFGTPSATDNCDLTPTISIVSTDTVLNNNGSTSYTRTWSASDACGNSSTCSQVITEQSCDLSTNKDGATDPNTNNTGDEVTKLVAYPNPAHDYVIFSMTFGEDQQNVSLEMFDVTGQKIGSIFEGNVNAGQEYKVQFQTNSLSSGTYYYRLNSASKSIVDKLTIVR